MATITGNFFGSDVLNGTEENDEITGDTRDEVRSGGRTDLPNDTLRGFGGNDTLVGDVANDAVGSIFGGDDLLEGGDGNDVLVGDFDTAIVLRRTDTGIVLGFSIPRGGDDTLRGGEGSDTLIGDFKASGSSVEFGNDLLEGGGGNDDLLGNGGNDTLFGGTGNDELFGFSGDDLLDGGDGDDELFGISGDDLLDGGDGFDTLDGGSGNDTLRVSADGSSNDLQGNSGNDLLEILGTGTGNNFLFGGSGNDTLRGGVGDDFISGEGGENVLSGGAGVDRIVGGGFGILEYVDGPSGVFVDLNTQTFIDAFGNLENVTSIGIFRGTSTADTFIGAVNGSMLASFPDADFFGAAGNDTITGGGVGELLDGGADDDSIAGGGGNDILFGRDGNDLIAGDSGNDTIDGGSGNDTLSGGIGNDLVAGAEGDDSLEGGEGFDTLQGGAGQDTIVHGLGADDFDGGDGIDVVTFADAVSAVTVDLQNQTATVTAEGVADFLVDIESVIGTGFGDVLDGFIVQADTLRGGVGDDRLISRGGADGLFGEVGDDVLAIDASNSPSVLNAVFNGGEGFDTLEIFGDSFGFVDLRGTSLVNFERLDFADQSNVDLLVQLFARDLAQFQSIDGSGIASRDVQIFLDTEETLDLSSYTITGFDQAFSEFFVFGDNSNETITGSNFRDSLFGGLGNDTLIASRGDDEFFGDVGVDLAVFSGNRADYTLTINVDGSVTVADNVGIEGVNTLDSVEVLQFADATLNAFGGDALTVTTLADVVDAADGVTSLREALATAELTADLSQITFDPSLADGTINLSSALPVLSSDIAIIGDVDGNLSADITIDGGGNTGRVFGVFSAGTDVFLDGLTITGGNSADRGGALRIEADTSVTLRNSVVTGNTAVVDGGGISVDGNAALIISNSAITNNRATGVPAPNLDGHGGGVFLDSSAKATIDATTISSNSAQIGGGGIFAGVNADLTLLNVALFGNEADRGGGLFNDGGATLTNATIAGNEGTFGGGGIFNTGTIQLFNGTITGNDSSLGPAGVAVGGIENAFGQGVVTLTNSIVLGNSGTRGDTETFRGTFNDNGANILLGADGIVSADVSNVFAAIDPVTGGGALGDNGGQVLTVALRSDGSNPALDVGNILDEATLGVDITGDGDLLDLFAIDATGNPREIDITELNNGGTVDAGAVERIPEAPSLVVTTASDVLDSFDNQTSLREAINAVNNGTFAPGSTITFASGAGEAFENTQTIFLASGLNDLRITNSLAIDGDVNGDGLADVVISADSASVANDADSRVITVDGDAGDASVGLNGIVLRDGLTAGMDENGGGILLSAGNALTLSNSAIVENETTGAGADGGGIATEAGATLLVTNSEISNNITQNPLASGGGLAASGSTVTLLDATISNNIAGTDVNSVGGGLGLFNSNSTLTNTTLFGNISGGGGGGLGVQGGTITAFNATISGNDSGTFGGGIGTALGATITLANSIVLGNSATMGVPDTNISAGATNIIGGDVSDVFASSVVGADGMTLAGALGSNGGFVQTIALSPNPANPAFDIAAPLDETVIGIDFNGDGDTDDFIAFDATGSARALNLFDRDGVDIFNGGFVDAGAVEATFVFENPSLVVTTLADSVDPLDELTSLREAIAVANSNPDQSTITFDASLSGGQINLGSALEALGSDITIDGDINDDGAVDITIDGGGISGRVFGVFSAGTDVVLDGLNITGGNSADRGGAIRIESDTSVTVRNSILDSNTATINGGAIAVDANGQLVVENSVFISNFTGATGIGQGGAVFVANGATALIDGVELIDNGAGLGGGGLSNSGTVTIIDTTFDGNAALFLGGGIQNNDDGVLTATNLTVADNRATAGGGIVNDSGAVSLFNATITSNTSSGANGGAGIRSGGSLTLTNSIVLGNVFDGTPTDPNQLELFADPGTLTNVNSIIGINGETVAAVFRDTAEIRDTGVTGGLLINNGGSVRTVVLLPDAANPALDTGVSLFEAVLGADLNGDGDMTDVISLDATGNAREVDQTDLTVNDPNQIDLGAVEQDIQVVGPNVVPVITSDDGGDNAMIDVAENTNFVTDVDATDVRDSEGAGLTYSITDGADAGSFMIDANTGVLSFIDAPDFETPGSVNGENTFAIQVTVTDEGGLTDVQSIVVNITDDAAVMSLAIDPNMISENGGAATGTVTRTGDTSGALTVTLASNDTSEAMVPASVAFADGETSKTFTVTAQDDADLDGDQTATITANAIGSSDTTADITITDDEVPNTPPVAVDDAAATDEDTAVTVSVLDNDLDVDGDPLSVQSADDGTNGTTTVNADGTITYTPAANFSSTDTFSYTISDGNGGLSIAVVTVNVGGTNALFADDSFATSIGFFADFTGALAAAQDGNAILINDPADEGDVGAVTINRNNLTIQSNVPFDGDFTLGGDPNNRILSLKGSNDADLTGNGNANLLEGSDGDNMLSGLGGHDDLAGGLGDDTLIGGEGNDRLRGGLGTDSAAGGMGDDVYIVRDATDTVTELAGEGSDSIWARVDFTTPDHVENIYANLGSTGLSLTGNDLANDIRGLSGIDTLSGMGGNDTLRGKGEADIYLGGTGDDVFYVSDSGSTVNEAVGEGSDRIFSPVDFTLGAGQEIETLRAMSRSGLALTGNEFNNRLQGSSGSDTLNGGIGNDQMIGGGGVDTFVFDGNWGTDVVRDFQDGIDMIDVSGAGITALSELSLGQNGNNVRVVSGDDAIILIGETLGNINEADFLFA